MRVMVFIDGSNIFWACRTRSIWIDYSRLIDFLVGNRELVRAYFYCAEGVPATEGQRKFHDKLRYMGIDVISKSLRKRRTKAKLVSTGEVVEVEKYEEKGVDVALATDMLAMGYKNAYDLAILVGADADYENAIREVKQIPKRVEIAAFSDTDSNDPPRWISTVCREMKMLADQFVPLENHLQQITKERF